MQVSVSHLPADQATRVCNNEALPSSTATEAMTINFMITVFVIFGFVLMRCRLVMLLASLPLHAICS